MREIALQAETYAAPPWPGISVMVQSSGWKVQWHQKSVGTLASVFSALSIEPSRGMIQLDFLATSFTKHPELEGVFRCGMEDFGPVSLTLLEPTALQVNIQGKVSVRTVLETRHYVTHEPQTSRELLGYLELTLAEGAAHTYATQTLRSLHLAPVEVE